MQELLNFSQNLFSYDWSLFFKIILVFVLFILVNIFIYNRFVQRKNQIIINYPLIGRLRYFFYLLRDPMRQYFGDETYYDSFEKLDWVDKASHNKSLLYSFSMTKPYDKKRVLFKHANIVLNSDELDLNFSVVFGENRKFLL